MQHKFDKDFESSVIVVATNEQESCKEVESLSIAYLWKIQCKFPQQLGKSVNIFNISEILFMWIGAGDVFSNLLETRMSALFLIALGEIL